MALGEITLGVFVVANGLAGERVSATGRRRFNGRMGVSRLVKVLRMSSELAS